MASIKLFLLSLVVLFISASTTALAAPNVTVSTDRARQYVNIVFADLSSVSRVDYILVYDTNRGQRGLEGGFKNKAKIRRSNRRQILGTCSSGKCVYHKGIKNIQVEATFHHRSGGKTTVTKLIQ